MKKTYYKVVRSFWHDHEGRDYESFTGYGPVKYEIGKPTVPMYGYGPLAVFDTLENAFQFIWCQCDRDSMLDVEIMEVSGIESPEKSLWQMWHNGRILKRTNLPQGTVLMERVIPIRLLDKNKWVREYLL